MLWGSQTRAMQLENLCVLAPTLHGRCLCAAEQTQLSQNRNKRKSLCADTLMGLPEGGRKGR